MNIPINFELMKNPFNWVILTLMVLIAGVGLHLIFDNAASMEKPQ